MKMTLHQAEALWESVEHYHRDVCADVREAARTASYKGWNCPCCNEFFDGSEDEYRCRGCPIFEHTWESGCRETPWEKMATAMRRLYEAAYEGRVSEASINRKKEVALHFALIELGFLVDLCPEPGELMIEGIEEE